jgi:hypothetical protein
MKPLKSEIKKDATKMLSTSIELIFNTLHNKYKTLGGDISPMQKRILDNMLEELPCLIAEQLFQNLDFTKFDIFSLNRSELMELAYSLDWNGSWDVDEEGQEPITNNELIEAILDLITINE